MLERALRRHWLVALVLLALGVGSAGAVLTFSADRYEAEARVLVEPPSDPLVAELGLAESPENVVELAQTAAVAERAAIRLRLNGAVAAREAVHVERAGSSDVVLVRGKGDEGVRAAQIANVFADEVIRRLSGRFQRELTRELARTASRLDAAPAAERPELRDRAARLRALQGQRAPGVEIVGEALPPTERVWPKPLPILAIGALGGLLLALLVPPLLDWDPRRSGAPAPSAARPTAGAAVGRRRRNDIRELERLLEKRGRRVPERRLELEAYLDELRARTGNGELTPGLKRLAEDVFADLRGRARPRVARR